MKALLITLYIIFFCSLSHSQTVPPYFNYQVVLRDTNNNAPLGNVTKKLKISILKGSENGSLEYQEIQTATTNKYGVASLKIGNGTDKVKSINTVNFLYNGVYYIKVEVDTDGNDTYDETISNTQLVSVPYAIVSGLTKSLDPSSKINLNQISTIGAANNDIIKMKSGTWSIGQDIGINYTAGSGINISSGNVISNTQTLSLIGNQLILSPNGGMVTLPNGSGGYWSALESNISNNNTGSVLIGTNILHPDNPKFSIKGITYLINNQDKMIGNFGADINNNGSLSIKGASINHYNFMGYYNTKPNRAYIGIIRADGSLGAGFDYDGVSYNVTANVKNFVMDHPNNKDKVIVYACIEGPEAGAYERGTAKLINGRSEVLFSEHFGLVVNPMTITINLTPISLDSKGLTIIEKNADGFIIGELHGGKGNYSFDWEVKGIRKGYEDYRVIKDKSEYQIKVNNEPEVKPAIDGHR